MTRSASCLALLGLSAFLAAGCGKKGPPLAPVRIVPEAVSGLSARRLGQDVHVRFTLPAANRDGSRPADLARVEVYAYTVLPRQVPTVIDIFKEGTLIESIPVRPPAPPPSESAAPPSPAAPGLGQGEIAAVAETLGPDAWVPLAPTVTRADRRRVGVEAEDSLPGPVPPVVDSTPVRYYAAVSVSSKGRRGPIGPRVAVPLAADPAPPDGLAAGYAESSVCVEWAPPRSARRRLQEPASGDRLESKSIPVVLPPSRYNVYEVSLDGSGAPAEPTPLNPEPLERPTFTDERIEFGAKRCYVVRTVNAAQGLSHEGSPSDPVCVAPVDTFPPAAPRSPAAVATEGAITLIWEPNAEKDLAGYLVLRAEAGGGTLASLTPAPIRATTYRDASVKRGVRYEYAVVAVDSATPPNMSRQSNRVEEIAR